MTGLAASSWEARKMKGVMPACFSLAGMLAAMMHTDFKPNERKREKMETSTGG